jgi:radical SAM superfamily enzyme YgiQ (UPF0313 family)
MADDMKPAKSHPEIVLFGESQLAAPRPLGIYVLASYLRKHGYVVKPLWAWRHVHKKTFDKIAKKFLSPKTKIIGISSTLLSEFSLIRYALSNENSDTVDFFGLPLKEVRRRFKLFKRLAPNAKIVVGGSQVGRSNLADTGVLDLVDLWIKGQGETALLALAQGQKIITKDISPKITDDRTYPYDSFNTDLMEFDRDDDLFKNESMGLEFGRGCIFKCSFCDYELTGKNSDDWTKDRTRLYEHLIKNYNEYGITRYYVTDDLINDSEAKVDMLYDIRQQLPFEWQYAGYIRLDLLRRFPHMATKLLDSGLIASFMGIETVNDASGRSVAKGLGRKRIDEALAICADAWQGRVVTNGGFVLGLPHDTPDSKYQLLEWLNLAETKKVITGMRVSPLGISSLGISDIDKNPGKYGYTIESQGHGLSTRNHLDNLGWRSPHYDFISAAEDSKWIMNEYYKQVQYPDRPNTFAIPYLLSISDQPDAMLELFRTDTSTVWHNNEVWTRYLKDLVCNHRDQYAELVLSTS